MLVIHIGIKPSLFHQYLSFYVLTRDYDWHCAKFFKRLDENTGE